MIKTRSKLFWKFILELYEGYHEYLEDETITKVQDMEFRDKMAQSYAEFFQKLNLKYDPCTCTYGQTEPKPFTITENVYPDFTNSRGQLDIRDGKKVRYILMDGRNISASELKKEDLLADGTYVVDVIRTKVVCIPLFEG